MVIIHYHTFILKLCCVNIFICAFSLLTVLPLKLVLLAISHFILIQLIYFEVLKCKRVKGNTIP